MPCWSITRTIVRVGVLSANHLFHFVRVLIRVSRDPYRSKRMHNPPHPGLVLREYLADLPVSAAAVHLRTTRVTLSRLLNGKAGISASMALRLALPWALHRRYG